MIHRPIQIKNLSLYFSHKACFEAFNTQIIYGQRIALIGKNGSGKSTLLKIIAQQQEPTEGSVVYKDAVVIGYVAQLPEGCHEKSGSELFQDSLTQALALGPALLLLDEPTNHLDEQNKKALIRMLHHFEGTLIVVSHDQELLRAGFTTFWHLDAGQLSIFSGFYDDYLEAQELKKRSLESQIALLQKKKRSFHEKRMIEQERASKRKAYGEKKYASDRLALSEAQSCGEASSNKKKSAIARDEKELVDQLRQLSPIEIIVPTFSIKSSEIKNKNVIEVSNASLGYQLQKMLLSALSFIVSARERVALIGRNGSGKTTLIKALLGDPMVFKFGDWFVIKKEEIGYLDQHYKLLPEEGSVFDAISDRLPTFSYQEKRAFLHDFLFKKNEEVNAPIHTLSGGERVRLCLALIAAKTPALLILDEITNNIDRETREYLIQVLKMYPAALLIISHDTDFLQQLSIDKTIDLALFAPGK